MTTITICHPGGSMTTRAIRHPDGSMTTRTIRHPGGSMTTRTIRHPSGSMTTRTIRHPSGSMTTRAIRRPDGFLSCFVHDDSIVTSFHHCRFTRRMIHYAKQHSSGKTSQVLSCTNKQANLTHTTCRVQERLRANHRDRFSSRASQPKK